VEDYIVPRRVNKWSLVLEENEKIFTGKETLPS
jgi:hypothetical protein